MREITTIGAWCDDMYGCYWDDVPHDYIYFSYIDTPDVVLRLVCTRNAINGRGLGKVEYANGDTYKNNRGMSTLEDVYIYGRTPTSIVIGGE